MSEPALVAHSLAEAYLYLMVHPCPSCGKGPLYAGEAVSTRTEGTVAFVSIDAKCGACGSAQSGVFQIPRERLQPGDAARINETATPSRIIDVGQWLVLSRMIGEAAGRSDDKMQVRRFGIQADQCIDEALKFYADDEELPAASAFFAAASRERFRDHPEQFARRRLLEMKLKLPKPSRFA